MSNMDQTSDREVTNRGEAATVNNRGGLDSQQEPFF